MKKRFERSRLILRWGVGAQLALTMACSDGTGEDSPEPVTSPSTGGSGTGGAVAANGTGGEGTQASGGSTATSGGTGAGASEPIFATSVKFEEGELGFCSVHGVIEMTNAGFSGVGYANADNVLGSRVEWGAQVQVAGAYTFDFIFATGSLTDRTAELSINGESAGEAVIFPSTTEWSTWSTIRVNASLEPGINLITLTATSADGLANIDSLTLAGAALAPLDCSPATGTGGADGTGGTSATGGAGTGGAEGTGGTTMLPNVTIYVAGDSTVSQYTDTASPGDQAGWGQMLHENFDERVTIENRAQGGRTALWFHLEGAAKWTLDRIQPGDYWFIQFGTNDSHTTATFTVNGTVYQRYADPNSTFKTHLYDYYIAPAREKNAVPVLVTPPPRNSAYCGKGNSLGGYAKAMRDLAAAEDVLLLDLNQRTFDHLAAICPAPTPENFFFLRADQSVDGTHFQENGAREMAGFLGDELTAQAVGPYLYLLP